MSLAPTDLIRPDSPAMDDREVTPSESLLKHIFGQSQPTSISIILQNLEKCVFKAELPGPVPGNTQPCVVRLEADIEEPSGLAMVAAMQEIAGTCIPGLVPRTLQVGTAADAGGRQFQFSVVEFVQGHTLEEVWDGMDDDNRRSFVADLAEALKKLHSVRLSDDIVQTILRQTIDAREEGNGILDAALGGPSTGFLHRGLDILAVYMQKRKLRKPFCAIELSTKPMGVVVRSSFENLGSVVIPHTDMDQWVKDAVFCHNDLTPRNLILRESSTVRGTPRYELTAIIDWELAGFYPPSYEISLQDTYLSGGNRCISFYSLLKQRMLELVPPPDQSSPQVTLLRAMELVFESQKRMLWESNNIPAHIRQRFKEKLRLRRDANPYLGWTQDTRDGPPLDFSRDDAQRLEDEMIAEVMARREAKRGAPRP